MTFMMKYLATLCFLSASGLIGVGISDVDFSSDKGQKNSVVQYNRETARPKRVLGSKRTAEVTEKQRQEAKEALLAAAEIEPRKDQKVVWSEVHFKHHLSKLQRADSESLVVALLSQNNTSVKVFEKSERLDWVAFETNHFKLISGLIVSLAEDDFMRTVRWLESLPILENNSRIAGIVYNEALLAGAAQAPDEAWRVYQEKYPPFFG